MIFASFLIIITKNMPENFSSHKAEKIQAHLNYWALNTGFMS